MTAIDEVYPSRRARAVPFRRLAADFAASGFAVVGLFVLSVTFLLALLAPWLAPQNPYDLAGLDLLDGGLPPGARSTAGSTYWLGTDIQGRDMLSAILFGVRTSLGVGVVSGFFAFLIGTSLGLIAAYGGRMIEVVIMRIVDLQLSLPTILLALILLVLLGQGIGKITIALVAAQWAYYARTARAAALVEGSKDYIQAARGLGLSNTRILVRHLLPNCLPPLLVVLTVQVAHAIALEATLSFLGIGLPVTKPSLGLLVANGFGYIMSGKYWISFFPGVALLVIILSINLVGDRLRDIFNPRLQS